ncbi:MAG: response regulator transcription factor [Bacillota bacterium]|nr:response regulator transcription factor [Bacillota bacterium]
MRALVIEDEKALSNSICECISEIFECEKAYDGELGLFKAEQDIFDVIILDIMLPGMNGFDILSTIREKHISTPVLILTARDGINDKIKGFRSGADDYLVKPFHREELLLRLEAILRRSTGAFADSVLKFKDLQLNTKSRTAKIGCHSLSLQGKQFDIMEYLMNNQNIIVTRDQIFDRIWGFDSETTTNVVEVYASGIRKELKKYGYDKYLKTIRSVGYILSAEENNDE